MGKSQSDISALRTELKVQKRLSAHPNVVRMLDAFETKNELVVVTEFVPGELHRLFDLYKGEALIEWRMSCLNFAKTS